MLEDYGALLRSAQQAVPDYARQQAEEQLRKLQTRQLQFKMDEAQRERDQQIAYQTDLDQAMTNPNLQTMTRLAMKYPKQADGIRKSWEMQDEAKRNGDLKQMGGIFSAISNGKTDLGATMLRQRIDADKAAGVEADPQDEAILAALESGDPVQVKAAQGMIGSHLAILAGPEKFHEAYKDILPDVSADLREHNGVVWNPKTGEVVGVLPGSDYLPVAGVGVFKRNPPPGVPMLGVHGQPEAPAPTQVGGVVSEPSAPPVTSEAPKPKTAPKLAALDLHAASNIGSRFGTVTSTVRTPEHNEAVGGVPNSWHTKGRAIDIARKPGVTHGQIVQAYRDAGYQILEQLDEGDHSHLAFAAGPTQTGGPQPIKTKQQYDRLPAGARYIAPDGSVRTKG